MKTFLSYREYLPYLIYKSWKPRKYNEYLDEYVEYTCQEFFTKYDRCIAVNFSKDGYRKYSRIANYSEEELAKRFVKSSDRFLSYLVESGVAVFVAEDPKFFRSWWGNILPPHKTKNSLLKNMHGELILRPLLLMDFISILGSYSFKLSMTVATFSITDIKDMDYETQNIINHLQQWYEL